MSPVMWPTILHALLPMIAKANKLPLEMEPATTTRLTWVTKIFVVPYSNNSSRMWLYLARYLILYLTLSLKEGWKGFLLLPWLWNDGRLQRRIFNGVGKLYVSLQLYCRAIFWGYLWCHISYHGNAQGAQKRPLNFSFRKLSEKLIWWPTIFISFLESSLNSLTFQVVKNLCSRIK